MPDNKPTAIEELKPMVADWPGRAAALLVTDNPSYEVAAGVLVDIKALRKKISESCDPVIAAGLLAHRTALAQKKDLEAPLTAAEATIKSSMGAYTAEQERLRREEERRRAAEERRQEAEQRRLIAEAEAARRKEEERRLAEAAALEEAGKAEEAEAVISAPIPEPEIPPAPPIPAPTPVREMPKAAGVSTRAQWSAEVTDLMTLVKAVAEGKAPLATVMADQTTLNSLARSLKGAMDFPGVRVTSRQVVAARAS